MSKPVSQKLNVSPIQLNNTRVLSDTYDKLLIVITKEVADDLISRDIAVKTMTHEEHGETYAVVIKCVSDKMCELYGSMKRSELGKGCYNIVAVVNSWEYGGNTGIRLDGYFIEKVESVPVINEVLKRMITPTQNVEENEVNLVKPKIKAPRKC